ncbi:hypothetical protein D3C75_763030 [compost metagenome]
MIPYPVIHRVTGQRHAVLEIPPVFPRNGYRIGVVVPYRHLSAGGPRLGIDFAHHLQRLGLFQVIVFLHLCQGVYRFLPGVVIAVFRAVRVLIVFEIIIFAEHFGPDIIGFVHIALILKCLNDIRCGQLSHQSGLPVVGHRTFI